MWPFSRTRAACAETRDWLLLGQSDDASAARAGRHLPHCPSCQRVEAHLQQVRGDLRDGDPQLDDVTRARMLDRLRPALDDLAAGRARRVVGHGRAVVVVGAAVLAAAAAVVVVVMEKGRGGGAVSTADDGRGAASSGGESTAGAAAATQLPGDRETPVPTPPSAADHSAARSSRQLALIRPLRTDAPSYRAAQASGAVLDPSTGRSASGGEGGSVQRMVLGDGAREPAVLGDHARLLLVGPAELEVLSASPELLEVRLSRGTLVGHYQGGSGERLRIFSPGARTEIVGTTFSIEAGAGSSRVAVAHGRVLVRGDDARDRPVTAGHLWTSSRPTATALPKFPRAFARLFSEHARVTNPTTDGGQGAQAQSSPPGSMGDGSRRSAGRHAAALEGSSQERADPEAPARADVTDDAAATPPVEATSPVEAAPPRSPAAPPAAAAGNSPAAAPAATGSETPATPPVSAGANTPPPGSPAAVYALAERAMSRGDLGEARRRLIQVTQLPAAGTLADAARYELAQITLRAGDLKEARARLESLAGSSLAEPAHLLACEVELRAGDRDAARSCYRRFRLRHAGSVQDAEALGALLRLSPTSTDCTTGRPLLDEYLTRYPEGSVAAEARQRRQRCAP